MTTTTVCAGLGSPAVGELAADGAGEDACGDEGDEGEHPDTPAANENASAAARAGGRITAP